MNVDNLNVENGQPKINHQEYGQANQQATANNEAIKRLIKENFNNSGR